MEININSFFKHTLADKGFDDLVKNSIAKLE